MRLATCLQPLVEAADHRVAANGARRRHVEERAHLRAAAVKGTSPSHDAAIAIERRQAEQRGYSAPIELAEHGQCDQKCARSDAADALKALQQNDVGTP